MNSIDNEKAYKRIKKIELSEYTFTVLNDFFQRKCESYGYHLLEIESLAENTVITNHLAARHGKICIIRQTKSGHLD